jgi:hypothetical protein
MVAQVALAVVAVAEVMPQQEMVLLVVLVASFFITKNKEIK